MAYDNTVTVVGNVTRDPELRFTPSGAAVANFGVAWNRKDRDGQDLVSFFDVTVWNQTAENVAESINKGDRVVVYGRLDQRSWETQDGDRRSKVEIVADDVAVSLRWATASIAKNPKSGGGAREQSDYGQPSGGQRKPKDDAPAYDPNEEPF